MNIVLDTNVIVSGFLNPYNTPAAIVQLTAEGILKLLYDSRILLEYHAVLNRQKFGLDKEAVGHFLEQIQKEGNYVSPKPLKKHLPDQSDEPFLEVALSGSADCLVTGNIRHFPSSLCEGMKVLPPSEFLDLLRKQR